MTFLQFIEFRGDKTEFDRLLERYRELMGSETTARRTWLLSDRDQPGSLIQIVEFDSYDDAMKGRNVHEELAEAGPELAAIKAGSVQVHICGESWLEEPTMVVQIQDFEVAKGGRSRGASNRRR